MSEFAEASVGISGALYDSESNAVGCISMVIPESRFHKKDLTLYANLIKEAANELSDLMNKSRQNIAYHPSL